MRQDCNRLLPSHALEPVNEFIHCGTGLNIFKQCVSWSPRSLEYPSAAESINLAFYCFTAFPIQHIDIVVASVSSLHHVKGSKYRNDCGICSTALFASSSMK